MPKYLVACVLFLLLGVSCKEDQGTELFVIPHVLDLEIVAGLNTLDTHIYRFYPYQSQYANVLQSSGFTDEDVLRVVGKSAEFGSVFSDVDLDFIREISVQIFDKDDPTNKREVFFLDPVPGNAGKTIYPFPALPDVKEFVDATSYGIEVYLNFRFVPEQTTDMRLEFLLSARN